MRRTNLGVSAIALTAALAHSASATAQTGSEPTQVADIVVVGARLQSERAVEAKREIEVISDSVTGDEAGSLPDFGLGEALDRVPGVTTIQNNARGESQLISIRGLNADYNLVQVDGVALPTTIQPRSKGRRSAGRGGRSMRRPRRRGSSSVLYRGALPQAGDAQLDGAGTGLPVALAVAPFDRLVCPEWCIHVVPERGGHPAQAADVRPFDRLVDEDRS